MFVYTDQSRSRRQAIGVVGVGGFGRHVDGICSQGVPPIIASAITSKDWGKVCENGINSVTHFSAFPKDSLKRNSFDKNSKI